MSLEKRKGPKTRIFAFLVLDVKEGEEEPAKEGEEPQTMPK